MNPNGGPAFPVSVVSSVLTEGGVAIPVYGYTDHPSDRSVIGGPAQPVIVITDSDLIENGGNYRLDGREYALPVVTAPDDLAVLGGTPVVVYVVNGNSWP